MLECEKIKVEQVEKIKNRIKTVYKLSYLHIGVNTLNDNINIELNQNEVSQTLLNAIKQELENALLIVLIEFCPRQFYQVLTLGLLSGLQNSCIILKKFKNKQNINKKALWLIQRAYCIKYLFNCALKNHHRGL